jgi:hypothetical protein
MSSEFGVVFVDGLPFFFKKKNFCGEEIFLWGGNILEWFHLVVICRV